jgi:hypothetical protein
VSTLTDLLPVRISWRDRPTGKHRESDGIDLLHCKLAGARLLIKGLRLQLDDKDREHAEAIERIDERHGEVVRGLEQQIAELERRLNVGVLAETAVTQTQPIPAITPVVPLHQSPQAKTAPSWAKAD